MCDSARTAICHNVMFMNVEKYTSIYRQYDMLTRQVVGDSESVDMKTISMMIQLTQFTQFIVHTVHNYLPKGQI